MLTILTLLKMRRSPNGEQHGERPFWREMGERYLEAWLVSVDKYVPSPKRIIVMTDSVLGIGLPPFTYATHCVQLDKQVDAPGFWAKLEMFRHGEGKSLYCDLDNVINGPLDELCALEPDPLIMLDDRRVPGLPNGSLILFDAERCHHIWTRYARSPEKYHKAFVAHGEDYRTAYDQAFIAHNYLIDENYAGTPTPPFFQDLLPDGYILNALTELPHAEDWRTSRVIFGCGRDAKPHRSTHPGFALR